MLSQNITVRCQFFIPLHAKGAVHNVQQTHRLDAKFPRIPAAVSVPILHAPQKGPQAYLVVVGHRQTPGGGCVKAYQNGPVRVLQLMILSEAQKCALQLLFILAGLSHRLSLCTAHPAHGSGDRFSLRVPAQEGPCARALPHTLIRCQPAQRIVRLLRGYVAHGGRLSFIQKPPPVGKAAPIVGRDQLGISVYRDDPLGVLQGSRFSLSLDHAQDFLPRRQQAAIVRLKCCKQVPVFPARRLLPVDAQDTPAHQQLLVVLSLLRQIEYTAFCEIA